MKNTLILLAVFFSTIFSVNGQKLSKMAPQIVVINIGAKNPTFNEKQYPNISFYYTPNLKPQSKNNETKAAAVSMTNGMKLVYEGTPDFLKTIWNDNLDKNSFMLFDKNGFCYTQGYRLLSQHDDIAARMCVNKKPLAESIKACVKKEKVVKPSKKEMKMKKSDFLVGHKMPAIKLNKAEGTEIAFADVLNGKPTLVVFVNIPENIDIQKAKTESKATMKSMFSASAGSSLTSVFVELEAQFFDYDARDK